MAQAHGCPALWPRAAQHAAASMRPAPGGGAHTSFRKGRKMPISEQSTPRYDAITPSVCKHLRPRRHLPPTPRPPSPSPPPPPAQLLPAQPPPPQPAATAPATTAPVATAPVATAPAKWRPPRDSASSLQLAEPSAPSNSARPASGGVAERWQEGARRAVDCSGRGFVGLTGECVCSDGFGGARCDRLTFACNSAALGNCSGHGRCQRGACMCAGHAHGAACDSVRAQQVADSCGGGASWRGISHTAAFAYTATRSSTLGPTPHTRSGSPGAGSAVRAAQLLPFRGGRRTHTFDAHVTCRAAAGAATD